jgi:hypothetical protein
LWFDKDTKELLSDVTKAFIFCAEKNFEIPAMRLRKTYAMQTGGDCLRELVVLPYATIGSYKI